MIELKEGVPPLTAEEAAEIALRHFDNDRARTGFEGKSHALNAVREVLDRYGIKPEYCGRLLNTLDAICQQAARAQAEPVDAPWHEQPSWRDQVAVEAMKSLIPEAKYMSINGAWGHLVPKSELCEEAYEWSDAMIAASGRGGKAKDTRMDLA